MKLHDSMGLEIADEWDRDLEVKVALVKESVWLNPTQIRRLIDHCEGLLTRLNTVNDWEALLLRKTLGMQTPQSVPTKNRLLISPPHIHVDDVHSQRTLEALEARGFLEPFKDPETGAVACRVTEKGARVLGEQLPQASKC